jgi:S1-C subfamily serine protease
MRRSTLWVLAAVLLIPASLTLPFECDARENSEFPTLNQLRQSNVALIMEGFQFASGLKKNSKGKINGKGFQLLKSSGVGSGFIATSDGSVITNYHVADKALRMKAMFDDKSTYEIRHISVYDRANDLAILKITSNRKFPAVQLGNSDEVQPMDRVLAVGNPRGLGINITKGDVSQVERDDYGRAKVVRHTAPITSGNSGGSLYKGTQVIGVNASVVRAAIGGESRFAQAIPINKAKLLLKKYHDRKVPLKTAFPTDPKVFLKKKFKSIDSGTGLVPAAIPSQKNPASRNSVSNFISSKIM